VGGAVRGVRVLERHEVARLALRELEREPDGTVRALIRGESMIVAPYRPEGAAALRRVRGMTHVSG